ncbi:MAG: hypothetical protein WCL00_10815, partial [Bacteroidota bacterium]
MRPFLRNIWLTLLLIFIFSRNTFPQQTRNERLLNQISKETNDTTKIKLLIKLGLIYNVNGEKQYCAFLQVFELSKKTKFRFGLVYGQYYQVLQFWRIGRYYDAIDQCKKCINALDSMRIIQGLDEGP